MAGKVLTAAFLDGIKAPKAGRIEIADLRCSGLSFRVTAAGARSWCFRFRDPESGATTRATIGAYPAISLKTARERADTMREQVAAGINPTARKREMQATASQRTFGALSERYMTEHALRHKRPISAAGDRFNLDRYVLPKWEGRPYASIRRADAIELVEGLISDGKQVTANRVHALISTVFSFAVDAGLLEVHPFARMKKRGVETPGDRVLTDAELRLFWSGIVAPEPAKQTGLALRLALLLGVRRSEAAGICRGELADLDSETGATWTIPGARTKNGREHTLPLPPLARETVLAMLARIDASEPYLLPTQSAKRLGPIAGETLTKAMAYFAKRLNDGEARATDDPVTTWTANPPSPHDLRRSLETRLAAVGIAKDIRDKVLNHAPATGDTGARHYDRHSYMPEKRAALSRWEGALTAILAGGAIEGGAVVALADRRAV